MRRWTKPIGMLVTALGASLALFLWLGESARTSVQVSGTRAGNLDAGSVGGARVPLRRGGSYMISLARVRNVGASPIRIESVVPQSSSPALRATLGRIWIIPKEWLRHDGLRHDLGMPSGWPGWPPKNLPKKPKNEPPRQWTPAPRSIIGLPTSETVEPGRTAQLVYGIFLHADPSARLRITALRITFQEGDRTFVWTYPEPVGVLKPL